MDDVIRRITHENLAVYEASRGRVTEDVSQESQVAHDYRGRLVYELLQNADDAMQSSGGSDDRILFRVSDDALWVANTGRALDAADVRGLCGLGASSKVDAGGLKRASIGHKGLGFKSVLEITDAPMALSSTCTFELGETHARNAVEAAFKRLGREVPTRLPAMRFPAPVTDVPDLWRDLRNEYNTAFVFPFADRLDAADRRRLADQLLSLPVTTVLFLKHLEEVSVVVDQAGRSETATWRATRERHIDSTWHRTSGLDSGGLYRVTVQSSDQDESRFLLAHDDDVRIGQYREGLSGPAWDGVDIAEVSVAALDPIATDRLVPTAWRHFHVFLPTSEPNPYPFLVNGAFTTDLSRQQLKVTASTRDYNGHLVRAAAQLFRRSLAPRLEAHATTSLLRALHADRDWVDGSAAAHLHVAVTDELADLAFIPSGNERRTLPETLVTPPELGDQGGRLVELLIADASVDGAQLPEPDLCIEPYTSVLAAHGACRLDAVNAMMLLAEHASPERSKLVEHESLGFYLDPVVELAAILWSNAEPETRERLEARAKKLPLFPVKVRQDGTVKRITLGDGDAFYPPQSARQDLPLSGLAFMLHDVCWGALKPNERKRMLDDRMTTWRALFDVSDFRFEEVMRAAVLPALVRTRDEGAEVMRQGLQSVEVLAAICQLAASQTKPDRPLRYQRLQSDRGLINLSRLPVPCLVGGKEVWAPAFTVYFGREWFPDDSVDDVIDALVDPSRLQLPRLAPPERFLGLLAQYQDVQDDVESADEVEDDEVGLDEDFDRPIETTERSQWVDFLTWVGVNRCLRPVHFHDVMDEQTWLSTRGLAKPQGWAFGGLGSEWDHYEAHVRAQLDGHPAAEGTVPYLYECHDIEGLGAIMAQAQTDKAAVIARALWRHLALHWETYQRFTTLELAMVGKSKSPGQRAKPPRAMQEERIELGENLWVHRMQRAGICPTSHGPRRPHLAWMPGPEVARRFTRQRGRRAEDILPVLEVGEGLPPRAVRSLADRLGVRLDLNPATFTVEDAYGVCHRLAELYGPDGEQITPEALRRTIRPAYRQVFALLSGAESPDRPRGDVPMLAECPEGFRFMRSGEVLYARSPGTKERSGVGDQIATFVIEADPAATRPLTSILGMQTLEDALDWKPDPGDPALDGSDLKQFRTRLRALAPWLLARLRAGRADAATDDQAALMEFFERVEPIADLELACYRDQQLVSAPSPRSYYVSSPAKGEPRQAFLVWDGVPWPPNPDARQALAMAMADALGVNHVETFLAFIDTDDPGRRQLLELAGAASFYSEIVEELHGASGGGVMETGEGGNGQSAASPPVMTAAPEAETHPTAATGVTPAALPTRLGAVSIPLVSLDDFELTGEIEFVAGQAPSRASSSGPPPSGRNRGTTGTSATGGGGTPLASRAAPGMDLSELDRIGMLIAMDYELLRLQARGLSPHVVPGDAESGDTVVVDVSTPAAVKRAQEASAAFKAVLEEIRHEGVSELHPGFDILTIAGGKLDRAIELKSSGVDARVQAMSWNEWKSASKSGLRDSFWLYLVNNLRADLPAAPFLRAIHDPFGTLLGKQTTDSSVRRAVQLRVREFEEAEQLTLRPRRRTPRR